jgi:hypothetical protein
MKSIFTGLFIADLIILPAAATLGWLSEDGRWFAYHFAMGLFGVLYTVFMHSAVYLYFIVSGKMVAQAVHAASLDPGYSESSRRLKKRTLRIAMLGILAVGATAGLGAWVASAAAQTDQPRSVDPVTLHMICAMVAIATQIAAGAFEFRTIGLQSELSTKVLAEYEAWRASIRAGDDQSPSPAGATS